MCFEGQYFIMLEHTFDVSNINPMQSIIIMTVASVNTKPVSTSELDYSKAHDQTKEDENIGSKSW